jgi:hypothetical protein
LRTSLAFLLRSFALARRRRGYGRRDPGYFRRSPLMRRAWVLQIRVPRRRRGTDDIVCIGSVRVWREPCPNGDRLWQDQRVGWIGTFARGGSEGSSYADRGAGSAQCAQRVFPGAGGGGRIACGAGGPGKSPTDRAADYRARAEPVALHARCELCRCARKRSGAGCGEGGELGSAAAGASGKCDGTGATYHSNACRRGDASAAST